MRVLLVHNRYQQRGGEDAVFESERDLLVGHGLQVETLEFTNDTIAEISRVGNVALAARTVWSHRAARRVAEATERHRAEIVHFHNTFPLVSPSSYGAARGAGAAVVQTLHNYRLLCPSAQLFRDGRPCEDCVGRRLAWPGIQHACYRESTAQTAVVAAMMAVNRRLGTWECDVDRYIALTEFARAKFVSGGLPQDRIAVKPNFIDRQEARQTSRTGMLFIGRLDESKGVGDLLSAWEQPLPMRLRIAGDGPLVESVQAAASRTQIEYLGVLPREDVLSEMRGAQAVLFPSRWYEGFPVTLVEAFATGTPVIASRLGAMAEIVEDRRTGLLFESGNAKDLTAKVRWADSHPEEMAAMGRAAHSEYEANYTPERNVEQLIEIYVDTIARRRANP